MSIPVFSNLRHFPGDSFFEFSAYSSIIYYHIKDIAIFGHVNPYLVMAISLNHQADTSLVCYKNKIINFMIVNM